MLDLGKTLLFLSLLIGTVFGLFFVVFLVFYIGRRLKGISDAVTEKRTSAIAPDVRVIDSMAEDEVQELRRKAVAKQVISDTNLSRKVAAVARVMYARNFPRHWTKAIVGPSCVLAYVGISVWAGKPLGEAAIFGLVALVVALGLRPLAWQQKRSLVETARLNGWDLTGQGQHLERDSDPTRTS